MRIVIFQVGKRGWYFLIPILLVILAIIIGITGKEMIGVFSESKELPIYSVDTIENKVALTFDCAWGAEDIPDILRVLKKENIKATFFIVGQWAEKFPQTVKLIAAEGHDIGNHSYSHLRMGSLDKKKIVNEISACGKKLSEISGAKVELFRAPFGDYNNDVIKAAKELNYFSIQWDVDSLDWKPGISQKEIMKRIQDKVKPGSILLFHNDTVHTVEMLPSIIAALKNNGYSFSPVSTMIEKENYTIDFEGRQKRIE